MATSRITLTFDPRTNGPSGTDTTYWLKVTVGTDPADLTIPAALDTCLVISKGSITAAEHIARVGTYAEVVETPLTALPLLVDYFESESLPADIAIGDEIRIPQGELPSRWVIYEYALTAYTAVVLSLDPLNSNRVKVVTPFPAFGRGIGFSVWGMRDGAMTLIGQGTDGTANRDYTGLSGSYFLASEGISYYGKDLAAANAWRLVADNDAWALVRAYDTAEYTTTPETRVYEEQ